MTEEEALERLKESPLKKFQEDLKPKTIIEGLYLYYSGTINNREDINKKNLNQKNSLIQPSPAIWRSVHVLPHGVPHRSSPSPHRQIPRA